MKKNTSIENTKAKAFSFSAVRKKWWFWAMLVLGIVGIFSSLACGPEVDDEELNADHDYVVVDLQTMFDELDANAMKAEKTYQDMYIQVTGKISNFDSDGEYISIEPVNADDWNFNSMMCYIVKDEHLDILLEKSVGDVVTLKGKIKSIGEVLGYSMNIYEVVD